MLLPKREINKHHQDVHHVHHVVHQEVNILKKGDKCSFHDIDSEVCE